MSRALSLLAVVLVLVLATPAVGAQDASPVPSERVLTSLGLPELSIKVYDDHFQVPALVPAGRTLISYENVGAESRHSFLLSLPDEFDLENPPVAESEDVPPPWFLESTFVGFPGETLPGETSYAVVDLAPGYYVLFDDFDAAFYVSGPMPEVTPVDSQGTVTLFDFDFAFPESTAPGRYVWEVTNTGEAPHELLLLRSPKPVTEAQVLELLTSESEDESATPVGGGPSFEEMIPVGGVGWLSGGATAWTEVELEAGTYVALCFVFDMETGMPHAMMGMIEVIEVA